LTGGGRIGRMTQAETVANRREYQRRWMAAKRKAVRDARGVEKLALVLPKALLADLRARKPKGESLKQWLVVWLRDSLMAGTGQNVRRSGGIRNAPCPCGSGRKHKVCCGKPS